MQALLQRPQWFMSDSVFTHARPQRVCAPSQALVHSPARQVSSAPHFSLHAPQCCGLLFTSTQALPQRVVPEAQLALHAPPLHTSPARQATPHAPQFRGSVAVRAHTPLQAVCPAGHENSQRRSRQVTVPPTGAVHVRLHAPQ